MRALIVGCGYLGTALGTRLAKEGAEVWGLRRQWTNSAPRGIAPISADLLKPGSLKELPQADLVVFCQAPRGEADTYEQTYLEGTRNLLSAIQKKPRKIIFISSTSVYGRGDGSWVNESTAPDGLGYETPEIEKNAKFLLAAEEAVLATGSGIVFRLGGIYGPGRHRLKALKEGKMKPSFSGTYVNRIRVEDIVAGIELLMEKGKAGEIYLGVDDAPSTQKEFYDWIYEKTGWPRPASDGNSPLMIHGSNKRCSNKKIKELGLKLKYPDFREGYAALLKEVS